MYDQHTSFTTRKRKKKRKGELNYKKNLCSNKIKSAIYRTSKIKKSHPHFLSRLMFFCALDEIRVNPVFVLISDESVCLGATCMM